MGGHDKVMNIIIHNKVVKLYLHFFGRLLGGEGGGGGS